MTRHMQDSDLALYASGDLSPLRGLRVRLHAAHCASCAGRVEAYRIDRERLRASAGDLPQGLDWDRLAAEMTANIHVGLAAGECVARRERKRVAWGWRPAAVMAGVALILTAAWWLNMPGAQTESLGRAMRAMVRGGRAGAPHPGISNEERGMVVAASAAGIELRENGRTLGVTQQGSVPLAVSVSVQGSASARYADADTGQITITSVYVQ